MNCPQCNSEVKQIPSGVSRKTGKPYNAFLACSNKACNYKEFGNPQPFPQQFQQPKQAPAKEGPTDAQLSMITAYEKDIMDMATRMIIARFAQGMIGENPASDIVTAYISLIAAFRSTTVYEYFPSLANQTPF